MSHVSCFAANAIAVPTIGILKSTQSIARRYNSNCESGTSTRFEIGEMSETPPKRRYVTGSVNNVATAVAKRSPRKYFTAERKNFFVRE